MAVAGTVTSRYIVLDANYLVSDWQLTSLSSVLLRRMTEEHWWKVAIPQVALTEAAATHGRFCNDAEIRTRSLLNERRRLGLSDALMPVAPFDYLAFIEELLEEKVIGFEKLPVPTVCHDELIHRAVNRIPPFDAKGSGYRDSLLWENVKKLAAEGHRVAFTSKDKVFAGDDGQLVPSLATEIEGLPGDVVLVRDLSAWLVSELPWKATNVSEAVAEANRNMFFSYLQASDILEDLTPPLEILGVPTGASNVGIDGVEWNGFFEQTSSENGPAGTTISTFDVGLIVSYHAELWPSAVLTSSWRTKPSIGSVQSIEDGAEIIARFTVLFDPDGQSISEVTFRPVGAPDDYDYSLYIPHKDQIPLFDA
ncbi:DUF4935 domain-containing protein [Rhodococcus sp. IC4_135]|jgi:hypothetical protein|uniref:PIN domain-containing protein n=1 Tax=Rhodococcus sp. IC4_135 TaxID=2715537 RepID=UPI00142120DF|nr:PIN domain-containing protein [uncultured Rhodococcus sp.]NHP17367.1 DUF4935 domain-containing protein [Rhodococcus sp. IC4_135]